MLLIIAVAAKTSGILLRALIRSSSSSMYTVAKESTTTTQLLRFYEFTTADSSPSETRSGTRKGRGQSNLTLSHSQENSN